MLLLLLVCLMKFVEMTSNIRLRRYCGNGGGLNGGGVNNGCNNAKENNQPDYNKNLEKFGGKYNS